MPYWKINPDKGQLAAQAIDWLILDVDGVMTDGTLYFSDNGSEMKGFSVQDGHGLKLWKRTGKNVAVITGRMSGVVDSRCADLGIEYVYQGAKNKISVLDEHLKITNSKYENVCYIGDELVDIPVFHKVGLAVAVANSVQETIDNADLVTEKQGGYGAVREITDFLLKLQGSWPEVTKRYNI